MKKITIWLLCICVLLGGCGGVSKLENDMKFTNERLNSTQSDLTTQIEKVNKRVDMLNERVGNLEMEYNNQTKIEAPKECVWFMPTIWHIVYRDISLDEVDNDDFWRHRWKIKSVSWVKYVETKVQSYSVVWDCVEHINQLWSNWWYETEKELFNQS